MDKEQFQGLTKLIECTNERMIDRHCQHEENEKKLIGGVLENVLATTRKVEQIRSQMDRKFRQRDAVMFMLGVFVLVIIIKVFF